VRCACGSNLFDRKYARTVQVVQRLDGKESVVDDVSVHQGTTCARCGAPVEDE